MDKNGHEDTDCDHGSHHPDHKTRIKLDPTQRENDYHHHDICNPGLALREHNVKCQNPRVTPEDSDHAQIGIQNGHSKEKYDRRDKNGQN